MRVDIYSCTYFNSSVAVSFVYLYVLIDLLLCIYVIMRLHLFVCVYAYIYIDIDIDMYTHVVYEPSHSFIYLCTNLFMELLIVSFAWLVYVPRSVN